MLKKAILVRFLNAALERGRRDNSQPPEARADVKTTEAPTMSVDVPMAGAEAGPHLLVEGWAEPHGESIAKVEVLVGHHLLGSLHYGLPRPDVAQMLAHPQAAASGFSGTVDLGSLPAGEQHLTVRVTNAAGHTAEAQVAVVVPPIRMQVDVPMAGAEAGPHLLVEGWAVAHGESIAKVEVLVGHHLLGSLHYGLPRPDVAQMLAHPQAAASGFSGTVDLGSLPAGEQHLTVRATDAAGHTAEAQVAVVVPPIRMQVDVPVTGITWAGRARISGWALGTTDPITDVRAFLGQFALGPVPYGVARPDVFSLYPYAHARHSGFDGEFDMPDTCLGEHMLSVRATTAQGQHVVQTVTVVVTHIIVHIDRPRPRSLTAGQVHVSGWAFSFIDSVTIARVEVFIGDKRTDTLVHGHVRTDVAGQYKTPNAERSGFAGIVHLPGLEVGMHTLIVRVTDTLCATAEATVDVLLTSALEPEAEIDRAVWKRGLLEVEGWVIWPTSTRPRTAHMYHQGHLLASTLANLSRPDIGDRFPTIPAASRSGFRLRYHGTPPDDAGESPYLLQIECSDGDGHCLQRIVHVPYDRVSIGVANTDMWTTLSDVLARHEQVTGRDAVILDWHTGLHLREAYVDHTVISPLIPEGTQHLPYLDETIDVVVIPDTASALAQQEALRVSSGAVVSVSDGRTANTSSIDVSRGLCQVAWVRPKSAVPDDAPASVLVSIIIPAFNNASYTIACLSEVLKTIPNDMGCEVIIVDDASTDDTPSLLQRQQQDESRLRVCRNAENLGFVRSCNRGAEVAVGTYIVFLNNDTLPQSGWLTALLRTFNDYPDAGVVGGKLVYPDGTLQEAGGVIFSDGSGYNFGNGDAEINKPLYNYTREVDYCSGALLATPHALFRELGGFDEIFSPAYYEDTDYCFRVREIGRRVYYQPMSVIVHREGATSGTDTTKGTKRFQVINQEKFVEKWRSILKYHLPHPKQVNTALLHSLAVRDYSHQGDHV